MIGGNCCADHCNLGNFCASSDIPFIYADDINADSTIDWIRKLQPDIIFCFGWSRLLKPTLLAIPPLGVLGFHPAALPANRGRHPLIWALVLGLRKTATTFFFMDANADSGDILSQEEVIIEDTDDAASLYEKITSISLQQIREFLPCLISRNYFCKKQDHLLANTWRKRGKRDGQIDWRMSANAIHNLVRGLSRPYIGAHFLYGTNEIKVWKTLVEVDVVSNIEAGKILTSNESYPLIKCGQDALYLLETEHPFKPIHGEYL